MTSHAFQGKTVDQVIVSCPVRSFSHTNEAQFYVSMSRARAAMYLFTDSKVALREAVCRPSERLSPWVLLEGNRRERALVKQRRKHRSGRLFRQSTSQHRRKAWVMSVGNTQLRSLHELYGEKEHPWSEKTEPIIRFWESESAECWGLPFFSLSAARFVPQSQPYSQRLMLDFPLATIWVTGGPRVSNSTRLWQNKEPPC